MAKRGGVCNICGFPKRRLILGFVILWVSVLFLAPHMPGNFSSSVFDSMDRAARTNALSAVGRRAQRGGGGNETMDASAKMIATRAEEGVDLEIVEQEQKSFEDAAISEQVVNADIGATKISTGTKETNPQVSLKEPIIPEETERSRVRSRLLSAREFNGDRPKGDPVLWDGTIFVGMAAYRDPDCQDSVWSAFSMAAHPERVSIGIYQQHAPEDPDCLAFQHVICPPQVRKSAAGRPLAVVLFHNGTLEIVSCPNPPSKQGVTSTI
jgi:hypothetical protein